MTNILILAALLCANLIESIMTVAKKKSVFYSYKSSAILFSLITILILNYLQIKGYVLAPIFRWVLVLAIFGFFYFRHKQKIRTGALRVESLQQKDQQALWKELKPYTKDMELKLSLVGKRYVLSYALHDDVPESKIKEMIATAEKFLKKNGKPAKYQYITMVLSLIIVVYLIWLVATGINAGSSCPLTL